MRLLALTIGIQATLAIHPAWAGGGSAEHIGVWMLDGANDPDGIYIGAVSENENLNKPRIRISCFRDDQDISVKLDLPNDNLENVKDGRILKVHYRVEDRTAREADWRFSHSEHFSEVPGKKLKPYFYFRFEDEDAVRMLNVLYIGDSLHLDIHLEDGEVITLDYDITGSRELIPRIKTLCNLQEPGEARDT